MTLTNEQIEQVMNLTGLTHDKAVKYYDKYYRDMEDDTLTFEDMLYCIELEQKGKQNGIKNVVQGDTPKKPRPPRTIKVSEEKIQLFDLLWEGLSNYYAENAQIVKNNKEIEVKIGDKAFKIDIIEHRAPKK